MKFMPVETMMLAAFASIMVCTSAVACGGIFDVACNLQHGGMSPDNIRRQAEKTAEDVRKTAEKAAQDAANSAAKAGQDVANALNELQASLLTGPTLAQAIISSRDSAINGSMPIPPQIRQQLSGYASEDSMNRVRYKIGDNGFVNLARLIEQGGAATAVTLIDVIVFKGPSEANDLALWAHELTHVDQYRDWGVHSFAVQYTRNHNSVEDPAYAKQNGFEAWSQQRSASLPAPLPFPTPIPAGMPPPMPTVGAFCFVMNFGRFGPGPLQPIGSSCFIGTPQGPIYGQIVP